MLNVCRWLSRFFDLCWTDSAGVAVLALFSRCIMPAVSALKTLSTVMLSIVLVHDGLLAQSINDQIDADLVPDYKTSISFDLLDSVLRRPALEKYDVTVRTSETMDRDGKMREGFVTSWRIKMDRANRRAVVASRTVQPFPDQPSAKRIGRDNSERLWIFGPGGCTEVSESHVSRIGGGSFESGVQLPIPWRPSLIGILPFQVNEKPGLETIENLMDGTKQVNVLNNSAEEVVFEIVGRIPNQPLSYMAYQWTFQGIALLPVDSKSSGVMILKEPAIRPTLCEPFMMTSSDRSC